MGAITAVESPAGCALFGEEPREPSPGQAVLSSSASERPQLPMEELAHAKTPPIQRIGGVQDREKNLPLSGGGEEI